MDRREFLKKNCAGNLRTRSGAVCNAGEKAQSYPAAGRRSGLWRSVVLRRPGH